MKIDPIPSLMDSGNKTVTYFARRDLTNEPVEPIRTLWQLPEALKILARQKADGGWSYHGGKLDIRSQHDYDQIETYRILSQLVELYGFNEQHETVHKAAEFLFSFQTSDGDFRGIFGNQYTPYYSAAIMETLIKAGLSSDRRIEKGFEWLLKMRQNDGGWAIPVRTLTKKDSLTLLQAMKTKTPAQPDRSRPFSHLVTGVVLRAFVAHPKHKDDPEATQAGRLLKSRFFKPDKYPDRKAQNFWTSFSFPFWFTDLLSSLDSLSKLGFPAEDPDISNALRWFVNKQQADGLWKLRLLKSGKKDLNLWIALAVCRVFRRFYF